jgi:DNA-directed RNA polymerase subunit K/omega
MVSVRTKQLMRGAKALVKSTENKSVVNALREVAAGHIAADIESVEH